MAHVKFACEFLVRPNGANAEDFEDLQRKSESSEEHEGIDVYREFGSNGEN